MSDRSELKKNILAEKLEIIVAQIIQYRIQIGIGLGALLVAALVSSVFVIRSKTERERNWAMIAEAQFHMGQKDFIKSRELLTNVLAKSPRGSASSYSSYYLGITAMNEGKFEEAIQNFRIVTESGEMPLRPLALTNLAFAQEQSKDFAGAAKTLQQFQDQFPDHFLASRNQLSLGRNLMLSGDTEAARKALGHLIDLYPASTWAENARRIMDNAQTR